MVQSKAYMEMLDMFCEPAAHDCDKLRVDFVLVLLVVLEKKLQ